MTQTPKKIKHQANNHNNGFLNPELIPQSQKKQHFISTKEQVEYTSIDEDEIGIIEKITNWWQELSLRKQVVILAIAFSSVPIIIVEVSSYYLPHHLTNLLIGSSVSAILAGLIAKYLTKRTLLPIRDAMASIDRLSQGKIASYRGRLDDLSALGKRLDLLSEQLQSSALEQTQLTRQKQLFSAITFRTRKSPDLSVLFKTAVDGARDILNTDRVVVYRFNPDWSGTMVAESVDSQFPSVLNETIGDPCFRDRHVAQYKNGRTRAIADIYNEPGITDCHIRMLEQYRVRANLVVPIRKGDSLMGLLIAHHCSAPRAWQKSEIDFLLQLASEVEYAVDYIHFIQEQQAASQRAWFFGDIAFRARQSFDINDIFQSTVQGARQILKTDRVMVYRFNPDWSGTMIAESVGQGWPKVLDEKIEDPCFKGRYVELYKNGRVRAIHNIRTEPGLTECHIRTLEKYGVKANLVAPLRQNNELMGLLIAHHCAAPREWQKSDMEFFSQLATQVEYAIDHITFIEKIQATAGRARLFGDIAFRARQSLNKEDIFKVTVQGARRYLDTDRVLIYQFNADYSGTMVAESVGDKWTKVLDETINDPCFKGRYVDLYMNGRVRAINDIFTEPGLTDCHIRTLERYEVKANLVAPIRRSGKLYGLLIAHNCAAPRMWNKSDIDFFSELATQTEYALDHISFIDKLEQARQKAEIASQEQRQQKEAIQRELETLLGDVKGAFQGDLTVRAQMKAGEIGMVAQFLNATIENLQKIVLQVQSASEAVTDTAQGSEENIKTLYTEAERQAAAITDALGEIQAMTESIQRVADNAQEAEVKVQTANRTLKEGDRAMNQTVDGILAIQETVEETAQKVKRLGEASQKISRVVNLIRDLANQTHVLALNASIEANGSDKEGQGFAVVAEEVRSLSEQSTAATKEIEQIVEEIQTETNQVVTAMETGREQVIAGTELVENTRQKLNSIANVSGQIRALVEGMAEAATAQAKTSASVSSSMQEVETIAQKTLHQSVTGADSFNRLLGVAKELQASVAQFKVQ